MTYETINVGDGVRRTEGRPENVGRTGIVKAINGPVGGDYLVTVTGDDGTEWTAYDRQLTVV